MKTRNFETPLPVPVACPGSSSVMPSTVHETSISGYFHLSNEPLIVAGEDVQVGRILFQSAFLLGMGRPLPQARGLEKAGVASGAPTVTILFISSSTAWGNLVADWHEGSAEMILRRCPICVRDSIVGP